MPNLTHLASWLGRRSLSLEDTLSPLGNLIIFLLGRLTSPRPPSRTRIVLRSKRNNKTPFSTDWIVTFPDGLMAEE